jgi:hypothetical protein
MAVTIVSPRVGREADRQTERKEDVVHQEKKKIERPEEGALCRLKIEIVLGVSGDKSPLGKRHRKGAPPKEKKAAAWRYVPRSRNPVFWYAISTRPGPQLDSPSRGAVGGGWHTDSDRRGKVPRSEDRDTFDTVSVTPPPS